MTSVVIADVDGDPATRPLAAGLVQRLRRVDVAVAVCGRAGAGASGATRVSSAVRRARGSGGGRPVVVLFGDETRQRRLVWGLALSGLLPGVRLVVQAGAARVPYEPSSAELFARAHVVVTESQVGERAVRQCCAEAGQATPRVVVTPPMLPSRSSLAGPTPADRRALRRARMDVDDDAVVVGCWADDRSGDVGPLAMGIFQQFARGHYWQCDRCGHLTPWVVDDHLRPVPCERCQRCGSSSGAVGRARDDTRLVLVGAPANGNGLWETRTVATTLGLDDRTVHETAAPATEPAAAVAHLWGCVDVHLQPHLLADVPAPIRVSVVLGLPIVATRYGAVEEWLAGAASLVPPRMVVDHSAGHRIALIDPGGALRELCRLADDRAARRLTAAGLREFPHGSETPLDRWLELLDAAAGNRSEGPCATW